MSNELERLPRLIEKAVATLAKATSAAEVLEAQQEASVAYTAAKLAARFEKLRNAHTTILGTCHRMMADALAIESRAQCRLADEYDAAQERGEVLVRGRHKSINVSNGNICNVSDIGLTRMQVHKARLVRNAEKQNPGIIQRTLNEKLEAGKEPMRADIMHALKEIRDQGQQNEDEINARNNKILALSKRGVPVNKIATEVNLSQVRVWQIIKEQKHHPRKGKKNNSVAAERAAQLVLDAGMTHERAGAETGIGGESLVRVAVAREEGRREAEAQIDPASLSLTAQEKLETAIRQHKRRLDFEFEQRVLNECRKRIEETILPSYNESHEKHLEVIKSRRGVMDRATFKKIWACLHPDRVPDPSLKKRYEEAFHLFSELELRLLSEKEHPTPTFRMPRTYDEMMALKKSVAEARKQNRQAVRPR